MGFVYDQFLTRESYQKIGELKTFHPEMIEQECARREKPGYPHTHLVLAAADHNARMIQAYQGNPIGLGNRHEYLARLVRMLCSPAVDGVEATPDIIEDLLVLNTITRQQQSVDFLAGKMLIGTVNRGGLKDACWELDDFCSGFTVAQIKKLNLDGVKFMLRINPSCEMSKNTLQYCIEMINQCAKNHIPMFLEGLFIQTKNGIHNIAVDLESLVKTVGVVSALGATSTGKWIELPLGAAYDKAVGASTASFLVVPDERAQDAEAVVAEYTEQVGIASNVRGILLGRNVMYSDTDPYDLATAIGAVWHGEVAIQRGDKESFTSPIRQI